MKTKVSLGSPHQAVCGLREQELPRLTENINGLWKSKLKILAIWVEGPELCECITMFTEVVRNCCNMEFQPKWKYKVLSGS